MTLSPIMISSNSRLPKIGQDLSEMTHLRSLKVVKQMTRTMGEVIPWPTAFMLSKMKAH